VLGGSTVDFWQFLLTAFGLMLVIEGILPFLSPPRFRDYVRRLGDLDDRSLRLAGLAAMVTGALIVFLLRP